MKAGTQIAYIPLQARTLNPSDAAKHPDTEFGFVTSEGKGIHFCRYWQKQKPGVLRTTANSKATPNDRIMQYISVPHSHIERTLKQIAQSEAKAIIEGNCPNGHGPMQLIPPNRFKCAVCGTESESALFDSGAEHD